MPSNHPFDHLPSNSLDSSKGPPINQNPPTMSRSRNLDSVKSNPRAQAGGSKPMSGLSSQIITESLSTSRTPVPNLPGSNIMDLSRSKGAEVTDTPEVTQQLTKRMKQKYPLIGIELSEADATGIATETLPGTAPNNWEVLADDIFTLLGGSEGDVSCLQPSDWEHQESTVEKVAQQTNDGEAADVKLKSSSGKLNGATEDARSVVSFHGSGQSPHHPMDHVTVDISVSLPSHENDGLTFTAPATGVSDLVLQHKEKKSRIPLPVESTTSPDPISRIYVGRTPRARASSAPEGLRTSLRGITPHEKTPETWSSILPLDPTIRIYDQSLTSLASPKIHESGDVQPMDLSQYDHESEIPDWPDKFDDAYSMCSSVYSQTTANEPITSIPRHGHRRYLAAKTRITPPKGEIDETFEHPQHRTQGIRRLENNSTPQKAFVEDPLKRIRVNEGGAFSDASLDGIAATIDDIYGYRRVDNGDGSSSHYFDEDTPEIWKESPNPRHSGRSEAVGHNANPNPFNPSHEYINGSLPLSSTYEYYIPPPSMVFSLTSNRRFPDNPQVNDHKRTTAGSGRSTGQNYPKQHFLTYPQPAHYPITSTSGMNQHQVFELEAHPNDDRPPGYEAFRGATFRPIKHRSQTSQDLVSEGSKVGSPELGSVGEMWNKPLPPLPTHGTPSLSQTPQHQHIPQWLNGSNDATVSSTQAQLSGSTGVEHSLLLNPQSYLQRGKFGPQDAPWISQTNMPKEDTFQRPTGHTEAGRYRHDVERQRPTLHLNTMTSSYPGQPKGISTMDRFKESRRRRIPPGPPDSRIIREILPPSTSTNNPQYSSFVYSPEVPSPKQSYRPMQSPLPTNPHNGPQYYGQHSRQYMPNRVQVDRKNISSDPGPTLDPSFSPSRNGRQASSYPTQRGVAFAQPEEYHAYLKEDSDENIYPRPPRRKRRPRMDMIPGVLVPGPNGYQLATQVQLEPIVPGRADRERDDDEESFVAQVSRWSRSTVDSNDGRRPSWLKRKVVMKFGDKEFLTWTRKIKKKDKK